MTEELAAALSPLLDRLALCVHRPSGRHPAFRAVVEELQLPAGSFVVVAARAVVRGQVTLDDLQLLSRYESRTAVMRNAQYHVERGFLREDGDALLPSSPFRAASELVLRLQADSAETLWADHAAALPRLAMLTERFVDAASNGSPVPTPAFDGQVATHDVVPATPASQLLARITELRYLRADLHAAALSEHDLAGPRARALGRLWKGHPIADDHGTALEGRGLSVRTPDGCALTDAARAMRDEVESKTNALTAESFSSRDTAEWEALVDGLTALPGDDPRPPEDR